MNKKKVVLIVTIIILILLLAGFFVIKYIEKTTGKKLVMSPSGPTNDGGREITYIFNSSYGKIYFVT
ncbi:MAG: hypothetical protein WC781_03255 [Candidatus Pacearchaeota archaeon]|jgi:hypothetical protein